MTQDPYTLVSTRRTRQLDRARADQVPNSAGGFVFELDDAARLRRFLMLGSDAPTYYTSAQEMTRDNAAVVIRMAEQDPDTLLNTILAISLEGRAPRQNATLFALAIAASLCDAAHRRVALDLLPRVARTGTHLFLFARYVEQFRGWGPTLRRGVAGWYLGKSAGDLAYQAVKYRQREGWSHRDLLRLSHPKTSEPELDAVFRWIVDGSVRPETPRLIEGFLKAQEPGADVPALVRDYRLSWEMLPDAALNELPTWGALHDVGIPQTALLRQLPRLTRIGALTHFGGMTNAVAAQLADPVKLKKARVHPINVLVAAKTYATGVGYRGGDRWNPLPKIIDALDAAFYAAYGSVTPSGKRTLLALDVSGSMGSQVSSLPISCREAAAALALVTLATEPNAAVVGFTSGSGYANISQRALSPLPISPRQRLDDVVRYTANLPYGGTDCALPWVWAKEAGFELDTVVTYTDNETWVGGIHPFQAVRAYREATSIPARNIVVGMTSTGFSIADPNDPGMLDVVGFDSAVPQLITDFSRG